MRELLPKLNLKVEVTNIIRNFTTLIFMINLIGCLFITASNFDVNSHSGWILSNGYQDSQNINVYISAVYFAILSCATVGYGDIKPIN